MTVFLELQQNVHLDASPAATAMQHTCHKPVQLIFILSFWVTTTQATVLQSNESLQ